MIFAELIIRLRKEMEAFTFVFGTNDERCICFRRFVNYVSFSIFVVSSRNSTIFISLEAASSCVSNDIKIVEFHGETTKIDK